MFDEQPAGGKRLFQRLRRRDGTSERQPRPWARPKARAESVSAFRLPSACSGASIVRTAAR